MALAVVRSNVVGSEAPPASSGERARPPAPRPPTPGRGATRSGNFCPPCVPRRWRAQPVPALHRSGTWPRRRGATVGAWRELPRFAQPPLAPRCRPHCTGASLREWLHCRSGRGVSPSPHAPGGGQPPGALCVQVVGAGSWQASTSRAVSQWLNHALSAWVSSAQTSWKSDGRAAAVPRRVRVAGAQPGEYSTGTDSVAHMTGGIMACPSSGGPDRSVCPGRVAVRTDGAGRPTGT